MIVDYGIHIAEEEIRSWLMFRAQDTPHAIDSQSIDMHFLDPEKSARDQELSHFFFLIVKVFCTKFQKPVSHAKKIFQARGSILIRAIVMIQCKRVFCKMGGD